MNIEPISQVPGAFISQVELSITGWLILTGCLIAFLFVSWLIFVLVGKYGR